MSSREQHPKQTQPTTDEDQRRKLEESEREAAKGGAENYQEEERDSKVVSTGQDNPKDVGSIENVDNEGARKVDEQK